MSIINPEIDQLLGKVDSKFTLCTLAAKRACQINDMVHGVREQAITEQVIKLMETSDIAKLTRAKPLALAMDEIASGDVKPEAPIGAVGTELAAPLIPQAETDALSTEETEEVIGEESAKNADEMLG